MQQNGLNNGQHDWVMSSTITQPSMPGSPTLTNPDMILPDYEIPTSPDNRPESPLTSWMYGNTASGTSQEYSLPPQTHMRTMPSSTPIIYGNGTMLSDIGEVTEVESNAGIDSRRTSSRYSTQTIDDPKYFVMNNRDNAASWAAFARERRMSTDSTSTIAPRRPVSAFADVEDNVSVVDSHFQGDDEESLASLYVPDASLRPTAEMQNSRRTHDVGEDRHSASLISDQAEKILANAKRRLLEMEGNLSRARNSLYSSSDLSVQSPTYPTRTGQDPKTSPAIGHSRIRSEDGVGGSSRPFAPFPQRSASALGSAGGYRPPFLSARFSGEAQNKPLLSGSLYHTSPPLGPPLEKLDEEDDGPEYRHDAPLSTNSSPTFGVLSDQGLIRSASDAQMKGIQTQMKGLKGKISDLREQAKADSMKRRSLQSLRTPSPFTHARWDHGIKKSANLSSQPEDEREEATAPHVATSAVSPEERGSNTSQDISDEILEAYAMSPEEEEEEKEKKKSKEEEEEGKEVEAIYGGEEAVEKVNEEVEEVKEEGFEEVVAIRDWDSESEVSQYHDTYPHAISHEDREDAFDYQNFFLHSALGSVRRSESKSGYDSECSDTSTETTRGPTAGERRGSLDSITSAESFSTAKEGFPSRSSTRQGRSTAMSSHVHGPAPGTEKEYDELENNYGKSDHGLGNEGENNSLHQQTRPAVSRSVSTAAQGLHRPSISSLDSTGAARSLTVGNKIRVNRGASTLGSAPDRLRRISEVLLESATALNEHDHGESMTILQNLCTEDRILIERLSLSLGQCVLGLDATSRASVEARQYRRRFEAARRILEGIDEC